MATMSQDVWTEKALVSIAAQSGTDVPFHSKTETIDIDLGEKDIEGIATVGGTRVVKFTPETDTTITLEVDHQEAGSGDISAATSGTGFFDLLHAEDTSQPYYITNTTARSQYRLAIMWTEDSTVSNAASAPTGANKALRITGANGYITSVKPSFTDGVLKFTITFKVPAFDASGNSLIQIASTDGSASMTALASYTSSNTW